MHDTFGFGDLIWAEVLVTKLCLSPNKSRIFLWIKKLSALNYVLSSFFSFLVSVVVADKARYHF